jgi:hypothetical protein
MNTEKNVSEATTEEATKEFWQNQAKPAVAEVEAHLSESLQAIDTLGIRDGVMQESLGELNIMTSASLLLVNLRLSALEATVIDLIPEAQRERVRKNFELAQEVFAEEVDAMVDRLTS